MYNDDDFNYNHGIALAATRNYKAAEEALLLIHNERYKSEYVYISWLARCYVMNGNPRSAWELYLKMNSSNESFNLLQVRRVGRCVSACNRPNNSSCSPSLASSPSTSPPPWQLIANDCYRMGHFMYAAKAFDVLERLDPEPEYWEGKRGACVGVFQLMIAGKASRDDLQDVLTMVRNTSNPQVEYIVRIIMKWCKEQGVKIT